MRLITLAIHTYERALAVKSMLEAEGIEVTLQNVNLEHPEVSSGVRVRISETDLPLALRIIENPEIFNLAHANDKAADDVSHTVIVPTNFSEYSFNAAMIATRIAARHKTELRFLHSYIDPHMAGNVQLSARLTYEIAETDTLENIINTATGAMTQFTGRLKDKMKGGELPIVKYSHTIVEGVPEDAIIEYAKDRAPYLVVMGTRCSDKKEKELIGSVTAEVLDECRFSVLTIPENLNPNTEFKPQNILFFSNLDQEDILAMDALYRYFPDAQSTVTIIHIPVRRRFTDRTAGRSAIALSDYCKKTFNHYSFETVPVSPKTAIAELTRLQTEKKFDMLVVPNRRKNALSRLFNPGLAHKILFQADIPMLVIPV